jgi:adenylate cyclase
VVITCLIACIFGGLLAAFLSRAVTKSLLFIEAEMSNIQNFRLDEPFELKTRILEVYRMKVAVDAMKQGLRSFVKYVPSEVVRQLIGMNKEAVLGAERREMTIMFTDIAGFTSISENMDSDTLAEYLAVYFKGMTEPIMQNKGTVDKYIGDAVMAFWGAPLKLDDHAIKACNTALDCNYFLEKMNADSVAKGLPPLHTRIGINTGEVVVGNFGYDKRMNYTVMGDHVNLASRLEGLNNRYGTRIIISEYTYGQVRELFVTRPLDTVSVKGRKQGVRIYELISRLGEVNPAQEEFLDRYNQSFSKYSAGRWNEARAGFAEALEMRPEDKAARNLMDRCEDFLNHPPDTGWTGVFSIKEKH